MWTKLSAGIGLIITHVKRGCAMWGVGVNLDFGYIRSL